MPPFFYFYYFRAYDSHMRGGIISVPVQKPHLKIVKNFYKKLFTKQKQLDRLLQRGNAYDFYSVRYGIGWDGDDCDSLSQERED